MTLFGIALKQQTVGLIAMTAMGVIGGVLNAVAFVEIAGTTPVERAAFAQQMALLGAQLSYMLPAPVAVDTLGGYLQWRHFGSVLLIFGIWAAIAASGSGRGDEERGLVEQWIAAGVGRARYIVTRVTVFIAVAIVAIAAMLLAILLVAGPEPLSAAGLLAISVNLVAAAVCCFGIGLVIAQLVTTRRNAAGISAGTLLALFLLNGAGRTADIGPLRWLSPFYHFERSRPLTEDGALDVAAVGALLGSALVLITAGVVMFVRRDLGGTAFPRRARESRATRAAVQ